MQELLVVGLIHMAAVGITSLPFWLLFTLRRRRAEIRPAAGRLTTGRWFAHGA